MLSMQDSVSLKRGEEEIDIEDYRSAATEHLEGEDDLSS